MINRTVIALAALVILVAAGVVVYGVMTPRVTPAVEASTAALPSAQASASDAGIFVSGLGRVRVKPNIATASVGVETTATALADAVNQTNTKMNAIIEKIKALGVAEKDIQTIAYNIYPVTQQRPNTTTQTITGYRVNNQLSMTIRKIEDVGKILDAVVAAGANNVYGISFGVDDPTTYQQQARLAAVKDAQDKAAQLAKGAGITLGKVVSITEGGIAPSPVFRSGGVMAAEAASVPIETGDLEISISVSMRFAVQ